MKKVLALVLAVVLAFGMTTVAFASLASPLTGGKTGKMTSVSIGSTVYTYDSDTNVMTPAGDLTANETYYMEVVGTIYDSTKTEVAYLDSGALSVKSVAALSEYKIRTAIDEGAGYISAKPTFVVKKVKKTGWNGNVPYITFKTSDKFNKEAAAVSMTVKAFSGSDLYPSNGYDAAPAQTVTGSVGYGETPITLYTVMGGPLANFDGVDEECEIEFKDNVVFKVNGKDQKDLFLRMSNTDDALETKYPDADLTIVKFDGNNKTFRRTGTLTIPADMVENKDGKMVAPVLYNYEGGKLTVNKEAKYNEEISAFEIKTNKLGNYVVTGTELKATATEPGTGTEEPTAPGTEPNPDTGANDFVGLAVALAVVSVAGIAVAKRK